jgi:hypothetical protein
MQKRLVSPPITMLTLPALLLLVITGMPLLAEAPPPAPTHDIYNPARTALVNAQRQLAESSRQQQEILDRLQRIYAELDSSLALLASAGELDPAMQTPIESIRTRLAALRERPSDCPMANTSSLDVYTQLLDELQGLIEHY